MTTYNCETYSFAVSHKGYYKEISKKISEEYPNWSDGIKIKSQFMRNIVVYVINLLTGAKAVSRKKDWFYVNIPSDWHSYSYAIKAQDFLKEKGLINLKIGQNSEKYKTGFMSVMEPTENFKELFKDVEIKPFEVDKKAIPYVNINLYSEKKNKRRQWVFSIRERIYMKVKKECNKLIKERYIAIGDNKKFAFKLESLKRLNFIDREIFKNVKIGFSNEKIDNEYLKISRNVCLTRTFSNYGTGCGRFVQKFGKSYQQVESEIRKEFLTINGELTSEVDFKALHPTILYHLEKTKPQYSDIYNAVVKELIGKEDERLRSCIKTATLVLINSKSDIEYKRGISFKYNKRNSLENKEKAKKLEIEFNTLKEYDISYMDIKNAFCKVHEPIAKYVNSGMSHQLMLIESDIMEDVLYEMAQKRILGVPLHDSIIVQRGNEEVIAEIMQRKYKEHTGFEIGVDTK